MAMRAAVEHARQAGKPWTLDPVAVGALTVRTAFVTSCWPLQPAAAIRGNASGNSGAGRDERRRARGGYHRYGRCGAAGGPGAGSSAGYRGGGHWRGGLRHRRRAGAQRGGGQSADDPGGGHRLRAVGGGGGERGATGRPAGKRGRRLRAGWKQAGEIAARQGGPGSFIPAFLDALYQEVQG